MLDAQKRNHVSSENESGQVSDPELAGGNPNAVNDNTATLFHNQLFT